MCQDLCWCTLVRSLGGGGLRRGCETLSEKEQKQVLVICHATGNEVREQKKAAANTDHM